MQSVFQFAQDIRYAARQLRRSPGFTASILLVLGLGIGANAAIFSVLNVTLLRRLPFERPQQLVSLRGADSKGGGAFLAFPDTVEWQRQNHTLSSIAIYDPGQAYLDAAGGPQRVSSTAVSRKFVFYVRCLARSWPGFRRRRAADGEGRCCRAER